MPLRIVQLGPYPPPEGGISRNILAIRDALIGRGHHCSIIATSRSSIADGAAEVYRPASGPALLRLLSRLKFDVLHLHIGGDVSRRVLSLAFAVTIFGRRRCVLTLHSGEYPLTDEARRARPSSIRGKIFRRFSRIVAVSDAIADVFRRYGVPDERIHIIPPYSLKPPDRAIPIPEELFAFADAHSPLIVSVGGLERDYDPFFQIDAMRRILAEFPSAGLLMIGDGSLRDDVEKAASMSVYAERVHLAGNIEHGCVLNLIDAADVLIRTTLFDGDAISIRESLFLGTPVVATENGERPEGTLTYDAGDREGFLRQVHAAMTQGKRPREQAVDGDRNIERVISLYEALA